ILIVGYLLTKFLTAAVRRITTRAQVDAALVKFLATVTKVMLLVFVILAAMNSLGVQTTSFIALIGAAGLAVGLALQGSLANFAAGVMLILFRPFKGGDYVETAGVAGTVEEIHIFHTVLRTPDNKKVTVPNSAVTGGNIINYSAHDTRRIDMVFTVGYRDDLRLAKRTLEEILAADPRVLKDPPPTVAVGQLAESAVNIVVRPWVRTEHYWPVLFDVHERVKERFDEQGVTIPYPQRDIHVHQTRVS
ncbi:MAG TPA: mechanosensitive ion channel, partial [candidate division Zixibacteria bacterium]|nr:mechanosensitive ion channel [candidate division Zixibacteria bacterium]